MKLSQVAQMLNTTLQGEDDDFTTVNTDTRTLQPGELFIALRGPHFDANTFVAQAAAKNAVGAIVTRSAVRQASIPIIPVLDTQVALTQLAQHWRDSMPCLVIAVTGSGGKTTTRALLASVFSQAGQVLASESSFNNAIGVPLTLLRLTTDHDYAVVEMGANHAGEIAHLTQITKPDIAIITNAGPAHLEGFGDLNGVANAKGEIFQGLSSAGTAIINNDDPYATVWKKLNTMRRIVTWGITQAADVMAKNVRLDDSGRPIFQLCFPQEKRDIHLPLMGEHNIQNALAAAAAGYSQGLALSSIKQGLETVQAVKRRLVEFTGFAGATIIDDSYNANPASVSAAIAVLASRRGDSILVLGDMLELGQAADRWHYHIGETAQHFGIGQLYCYGKHSRQAAAAFGTQAYHFDDQASLIRALRKSLRPTTIVLVKGSLGMKMNNIVASLLEG